MNNRKSLLAKIHIAKKELALENGVYRGILLEKFGVESAGELKIPQLAELVDHLEKLGFKPKQKNRPSEDTKRIVKRIWAQCYSLGRPVPEYADGMARQMFKVDKVIWCDADQLKAITSALAYQQEREGAETE